MRLCVDDLWTPEDCLPGGPVLAAIAARCGDVWNAPRLAARVRIGYNPRLRTTLGRALLEENRVELNVRLLRKHPEHLVDTLAHELAHMLVHLRHGKVPPHGPQFRRLMHAVDLSPKATHKLPAASLLRQRRYLYLHRCSDCGYRFLARKPRRGTYCAACGPEMTWDIWRAPNTPKGRELLNTMLSQEGKPI